MYINVATGPDARVDGVDPISGNDLGVRYSGFRSLDRFDAQTNGMNIGHISWPGGALAEASPDRFGLNYDGLFNPALGQPGIAEMMAYANETGSSLSVVLPTARYANDMDQLRADMREFMGDLLGGDYGPLPDGMFLHIGSEHYAHFQNVGGAAAYGRVAAAMVEEITGALEDPSVNLVGAKIDVAVQAGRSMTEDTMIRDAFTTETLAEVDMVTHHRYAAQADGIDAMLRQFRPINEAWKADVLQAGGEEPQINLGEWNVASVTRSEAASRYIRDMQAQGETVRRADIDLEGRTDTRFEQYYQNLLDTRDYGAAQPQLYLEMFSEYAAEGLGAASIHSADLMHAGRMTFADVNGEPVRFVGAELIDMLYESVEGTTVLEISEANRANSPIATYGFESDDRLVLFVAADENVALGDVTLNIEGLNGGYTAIWTDSLSAEVPEDWMQRFGIPDNANVDESNEGETYAIGVRGDVDSSINGSEFSVTMTEPGQVVRIVVARTPEEAARIAEWAGAPDYGTVDGLPADDDADADDTATDPIVAEPPTATDETDDNLEPPQPSWLQWHFPSFGGGLIRPVVTPMAAPMSASSDNSAGGHEAAPGQISLSEERPSLGRSVADWLASFRDDARSGQDRSSDAASRHGPQDTAEAAKVETSSLPRAAASATVSADASDEALDSLMTEAPLTEVDTQEDTSDEDMDGQAHGILGELTSMMGALSGIAVGGMLMAMSKGVF